MENNEKQPFLLKNIFSKTFVERVANEVFSVHPTFNRTAFLTLVFDENWGSLELKQRMRHLSTCLKKSLPPKFSDAVSILVKTAEKMLARDGEGMTLEWMIFPDFVEAFGVDDFENSMPALEILTRLASAEFAVRPFLLKYPTRIHDQMLVWSRHESSAVRRLASEGFRPRLPWGMGVPSLKKDPSPTLPILEILKNDTAETVRRSVANHLNDISKDHIDLALSLAERWKGQNADLDWVVRHALRGLLKKGNPVALRLFGFESGQSSATVFDLKCSPNLCIGERLFFSFNIKNTSDAAVNLRLEYAINYQTLSGKIARKVFKISELSLASTQVLSFEKSQRFQDFTTRKHFAGPHRIDILTNGIVATGLDFELRSA
jgi:3-methyladenine DNA glycosylase AlkC